MIGNIKTILVRVRSARIDDCIVTLTKEELLQLLSPVFKSMQKFILDNYSDELNNVHLVSSYKLLNEQVQSIISDNHSIISFCNLLGYLFYSTLKYYTFRSQKILHLLPEVRVWLISVLLELSHLRFFFSQCIEWLLTVQWSHNLLIIQIMLQ